MSDKSLQLVDSLAVRYRPHKFEDIVGNSANIKTIKGFLQKGQLPRTWLFSGDPGSGKTSSSRILSMVVNCRNIASNIKNGNVEPCLECDSCKLALQNKHPDIIEINSGGEEGNAQGIRDLLGQMKLAPRFNIKCFILDECLPLNTHILLSDDSTISLQEILDTPDKQYKVVSYNTTTRCIDYDIIEKAWLSGEKEMLEIELEDGSKQRCSTNHRWWCSNKFCYLQSNELQIGDTLTNSKFDVKIKNITPVEKENCCNITVSNNHNFFVKFGSYYILSSNCHLMSNVAKSNLLKPLEEPPKHVLWSLCTTDPDKLPKAALTRCIKLYYEYPTITDCSKQLWKVAKKEYKELVSERLKPFVKKIAQNTNGQMRDGYSLLEAMASIIEADKNITDEELKNEFVTILTSLGELTTPSIRFITYTLLEKYTLPLGIINDLDQSRLAEFLSTLARHAHYASMYFSHKKEDNLKELNKKRFYGINFIRFDEALNTIWDKLIKKYNKEQILYKIVCLCGGVLEAINKNRLGLLNPEQAILCAINTYMQNMYLDKTIDKD